MKTKTCILAIIVGGSLTNGLAQDTWTRKGDFGGGTRGYAVGFTIDGKGYLGTGDNFGLHDDFWEYDPITNVWTQKANFGGGLTSSGVGFGPGGKGYLLPAGRNDFWQFDPVANTWTQKSDFAGVERQWSVGISIGSKGYVGTGTIGPPYLGLKDFWEYDPAINAWTQKADFGGTARTNAAGFSIGSKGYIGTGNDSSNNLKDFWEYDSAADSWTQKADFEGEARQYATGLSIDNKGYIGTGNGAGGSGSFLRDFWEYDPTTNAWARKADFGGTGRYYATGFSIGSKGYLGTGYTSSSFVKDFWEYTPGGVAAYRDVVLADNPIMYWRLGETCGKVAHDESANHRDATYIHHPSLGLNGAIANDRNTSVGFNGCNQWAGWRPTSRYSGAFTVEAWVKVKNIHPIQTFLNTRTATAEYSFDFKFDTLLGKEIRMDVGDGSHWLLAKQGVPFDFRPDVWYYVAAVVTRRGATYYVDGSAIGSVTYSGIPLLFDATHKVEIGTNTRFDSEWFDGAIDEVAVYDCALTADQIAAHYATGTGH